MKHLILGKLKAGETIDYQEVQAVFKPLLQLDGIHGVRVLKNAIARDNRYDIMIEIDMETAALPAYDQSEPHHYWKDQFCPKLEKKAIFDYEE